MIRAIGPDIEVRDGGSGRLQVYWRGPFEWVHVGTLPTEGLVAIELAIADGTPPPPPGSVLRGNWAPGYYERLRGAPYSAEERETILLDLAAWPGTLVSFCRARGVARSTIYRWRSEAGARGRLVAIDGGKKR